MTLRSALVLLGLAVGCVPMAASADLTGTAGGSQPQTTVQPSLAATYIVRTDGVFTHLGDVGLFAGNFAPAGWMLAQGQLLPISQYTSLFSVIGTTYGGDGQTTFALPDLSGRTPIGTGTGPGLSPQTLGNAVGVESVTLTTAQLAAHAHTMAPPVGATGATGGNQPYTNMQPSLALNYTIPLVGIYPSTGGGVAITSEPMLGFVELNARGALSVPNGYAAAQGQLLPINQNQALFSLLGTTYGGNGQTTFALPDLRGRAVVGAGNAPGLTPVSLGQSSGVESVSLTQAQMPSHDHTLPPTSDFTGLAGGGLPQTNMQPSLGLNYVIALNGIYPSRDDGPGVGGTDNGPLIGEIALFAGNFAPSGWAFAAGQLLPINQNTALFSLLGTIYGGDGITTFALPDLRGHLALGWGQGPGLSPWFVGETGGVESLTLTQAQMPMHSHTYAVDATVPEPGTLALFGAALAGLGYARRRASS